MANNSEKSHIGCCGVAAACFIAGGVMWGVCNDPTIAGCNPAIKIAGQVLVYTGTGIVAASACCLATVCCCAFGIGVCCS